MNLPTKPKREEYETQHEWKEAVNQWLEMQIAYDEYLDRDNEHAGLYDDGLHPIPENWAEYADIIHDRSKE